MEFAHHLNELDKTGAPAPLTFPIPDAGAMAGLAKNGSYAAARRGEIPVIKFGGKRRVPAVLWKPPENVDDLALLSAVNSAD